MTARPPGAPEVQIFKRDRGPVLWLGLQNIMGMAMGMTVVIMPGTFAEGGGVIFLTGLRICGAVVAALAAFAFVFAVLRPGQVLRIDQDGLINAQHRGFSFLWPQVRAIGEGFDGARLSRLRFIVEQPDGSLNARELAFKDWDASPEQIVNAIRWHLGPGMSPLKDVTPS